MKSVGEVMAIGRTWEESLQKAVRMIDPKFNGFESMEFEDLDKALKEPTDQRLFAVGSAMMNHGYSVDKIHALTKIDKWFLHKLDNIFNISKSFSAESKGVADYVPKITKDKFVTAKRAGFSDIQIAKLCGSEEMVVRKARKGLGVIPFVKKVLRLNQRLTPLQQSSLLRRTISIPHTLHLKTTLSLMRGG
jgi:carbamoyl-phosphate synthase large subunit